MTMMILIKILAFAVAWIACGFIMAMYYEQFLCDHRKGCTTCIHITKRWHKNAWIMDGVGAVIAVIYLYWLLH